MEICIDTQDQDNDLWKNIRFGRVIGTTCYSLYTHFKDKKVDSEKKLKNVFR